MLPAASGAARCALADARRLVRLDDLLYLGGDALMRWGGRIFVPLVLAAIGGVIAPRVGLPGLSVPEAILLPLALSGGLVIMGAACKFIPMLFQGVRFAMAEAQDLNLMNDYKKARVANYLDRLWDRVYCYESPRQHMNALDPLEQVDGADLIDVIVDRTGTDKQRFMDLARGAIAWPIPQMQQRREIGYDLSLLHDVLDGAPCHHSDNKSMQQYRGNSILRSAQEMVGRGKVDHAPLVPYLGLSQYIWFNLIMREIAFQVGSALTRLRRQFPDDRLSTQTLLWPGSEQHMDDAAACRAVLDERARVLHRVFGPDLAAAKRMLHRLYLPNFIRATALRIRFDAQYCTGSLGYTARDDLAAIGLAGPLTDAYRVFHEQAAERLRRFRQAIEVERPDVAEHGEWLRAAKTAFHVNHQNMQHHFRHRRARMHRTINSIGEHLPLWTDRLLSVRVHQQLTVMEMIENRRLLSALYASLDARCEPAADAAARTAGAVDEEGAGS